MVSALDLLFGVVVVAGLVLGGLGFVCYRRWDQLGTASLAVFAVVLGFGSAFSGVVGLVDGPDIGTIGTPVWGQFAILFWALASVPWLLFALQYTGRYTRVRPRTVGLLYAPFVSLLLVVVRVTTELGSAGIINALTSVVFIYCFALVFLGAYLVIQATSSYFHLSTGQGVALATTPIIVVISSNTVGALLDAPGLLVVGQYTAAVSIGVVTFGVAVLREPILEATPAVERIGEETITRETDDLVVVADGDGTVIECNATARETLDEDTLLGRPLAGLLGAEADELAERETVPLETTAGKRRYDPQVSPVTDDRGTELGVVLSLRDVTDRELREQRLAVLNRVLRHNLRNKVDVIKSHAEALDANGGRSHSGAIAEAADEITELGYSARTIDQFVSESTEKQRTDLVEVVETARTDCEGRADDVTVRGGLRVSRSRSNSRRRPRSRRTSRPCGRPSGARSRTPSTTRTLQSRLPSNPALAATRSSSPTTARGSRSANSNP